MLHSIKKVLHIFLKNNEIMDGKSILIGIAISVAFSMIYHDKFEGKIKQIPNTYYITYL